MYRANKPRPPGPMRGQGIDFYYQTPMHAVSAWGLYNVLVWTAPVRCRSSALSCWLLTTLEAAKILSCLEAIKVLVCDNNSSLGIHRPKVRPVGGLPQYFIVFRGSGRQSEQFAAFRTSGQGQQGNRQSTPPSTALFYLGPVTFFHRLVRWAMGAIVSPLV